MSWGARAAVWALCGSIAGCAGLKAPRPAAEQLAGRLSLQVQGDAARSFHAAFELEGSAQQGRLTLTTPIGTQAAQADWSADRVRLRTGASERFYPDLGSLAADALGERVPLAALFDWLRGRPWPGAPSTLQTGGFAQLGWEVDLRRQAEGWIEARRSGTPAVSVRVKLDDR